MRGEKWGGGEESLVNFSRGGERVEQKFSAEASCLPGQGREGARERGEKVQRRGTPLVGAVGSSRSKKGAARRERRGQPAKKELEGTALLGRRRMVGVGGWRY